MLPDTGLLFRQMTVRRIRNFESKIILLGPIGTLFDLKTLASYISNAYRTFTATKLSEKSSV